MRLGVFYFIHQQLVAMLQGHVTRTHVIRLHYGQTAIEFCSVRIVDIPWISR